jgi:hypothetical protein
MSDQSETRAVLMDLIALSTTVASHPDVCSQCGEHWNVTACGFSHVQIQTERETFARSAKALLPLLALALKGLDAEAEIANLVKSLDEAMCSICDQTIRRGHAPDCPFHGEVLP